jgi:hypothetical protein
MLLRDEGASFRNPKRLHDGFWTSVSLQKTLGIRIARSEARL